MSILTNSPQDCNTVEGYFPERDISVWISDPKETYEVDPEALDPSLLDREILRYKRKKRLYNQAVTGLKKNGYKDLSEKVKACGAELTVIVDENYHVARSHPAERCSSPFCPECSSNKGQKNVRRHFAHVSNYLHENPKLVPCSVTLTMRDADPEWQKKDLRSQRTEIQRMMAKGRSKKEWKDHVEGGIYAIEATFNEEHQRWHTHVHMLIFLKEYWDQEYMVAWWEKAAKKTKTNCGHFKLDPTIPGHETFGGWNLSIRRIKMAVLEKGLKEILKYPYKVNNVHLLSKDAMGQVLDCKGQRASGCFGEYRKHRITRQDVRDFFDEEDEMVRVGDLCRVCAKRFFQKRMRSEEFERKCSVIDLSNAPPEMRRPLKYDGPEVSKWQ